VNGRTRTQTLIELALSAMDVVDAQMSGVIAKELAGGWNRRRALVESYCIVMRRDLSSERNRVGLRACNLDCLR
jgi:hypothetical protein